MQAPRRDLPPRRDQECAGVRKGLASAGLRAGPGWRPVACIRAIRAESLLAHKTKAPAAPRQGLTHRVTFARPRQERQALGRYWPGMVLLQVHCTLPTLAVIGESCSVVVLVRALLALGPP